MTFIIKERVCLCDTCTKLHANILLHNCNHTRIIFSLVGFFFILYFAHISIPRPSLCSIHYDYFIKNQGMSTHPVCRCMTARIPSIFIETFYFSNTVNMCAMMLLLLPYYFFYTFLLLLYLFYIIRVCVWIISKKKIMLLPLSEYKISMWHFIYF